MTVGVDGRPAFLVAFQPSAPADDLSRPNETDQARRPESSEIELELRDTRERLQGTIEEYETALEELKSANEELISLNEEFQSSNEELESTKEELQSLNEELQTVNQELMAKVEDLDRANNDLVNLFASTHVATIFLDTNLSIRSFTPAASNLFNIITTDRGRPFGDLAIKLDYPEIHEDIQTVLKTGKSIERRTQQSDGGHVHFLSRLTPYHDEKEEIDGVVATFVDVTTLAKSEERQRTLLAELNHRVKNLLTVIVALAKQTLPQSEGSEAFLSRIYALARSHELLARESYGDVPIEKVVSAAVAPYLPEGDSRLTRVGASIALPPKIAMSLGMILDELATNAIKYGALSVDSGRVSVDWSLVSAEGTKKMLCLEWREHGRTPVTKPETFGFGLTIIEREVKYSLSGEAAFDFKEDGFSASFKIPLKRAASTPA